MEKKNVFPARHWRSLSLIMLLSIPFSLRVAAQEIPSRAVMNLSLNDAVQLAKQQNKWVHIAQTEEEAVKSDLQDVKNGALPQIGFSSSYQRFTKVTLFDGGLADPHSVPRRPNQNSTATGFDAAFTLFAGGRQKAAVKDQDLKRELSSLNTLDQTGTISLQVVAAYLDIIRLNEQDSLIGEQIKRAETRYKNIQTLFQYQKVTRSDLLRAQLILSNQKLSREQNENDITIAIAKMDVLLDLPQDTHIIPTDSVSGEKKAASTLSGLVGNAATNAYVILKAKENVALQANRVQSIKANYFPTVQLYGAYGLNYPNYLGFPPVNQFYLLGFAGIKMQYNISSLYQNKHKTTAAKVRLDEVRLQAAAVKDNVTQEANAVYIKYGESLDRIKVAQESIEQATANYKIVSAKYFNQLALLTDLLDADNLYLESRYNLIRSQTDALAYYYRLMYISGKL